MLVASVKIGQATHWKKPENSVLGEGALPSSASRRSIVDNLVKESMREGEVSATVASSYKQVAYKC